MQKSHSSTKSAAAVASMLICQESSYIIYCFWFWFALWFFNGSLLELLSDLEKRIEAINFKALLGGFWTLKPEPLCCCSKVRKLCEGKQRAANFMAHVSATILHVPAGRAGWWTPSDGQTFSRVAVHSPLSCTKETFPLSLPSSSQLWMALMVLRSRLC